MFQQLSSSKIVLLVKSDLIYCLKHININSEAENTQDAKRTTTKTIST